MYVIPEVNQNIMSIVFCTQQYQFQVKGLRLCCLLLNHKSLIDQINYRVPWIISVKFDAQGENISKPTYVAIPWHRDI
jgi:hypothetical protein